MLPVILSAAAALAGFFAIRADRPGARSSSFYVLKPLTTLLIVGVAATVPGDSGEPYRIFILGGLSLALAGDILLMRPGHRPFVAGLGSFLCAHVLFASAFLLGVGELATAWTIMAGTLALGVGAVLVRRAGPLRLPVAAYVAALAGMVAAAASRMEALSGTGPMLAFAGALMFAFSDGALGVRQFIRPFPRAQELILSTYWPGVALIAWSV